MFKPNHYYCVIHRDFATAHPIKCLIKVGNKFDGVANKTSWDIEVIMVFKKSHNISIRKGTTTYWFEEWCEILKEFNHYPNESEILAFAL